MNIRLNMWRPGGFSLALVLVFTGILFLLLSGLLLWTTTNGNLTQRYNEYYDSVAASEAATEKVVAAVAADFQRLGAGGVDANLSSYHANVPTQSEVGEWGNYQFNDPSGIQNATYVSKLTSWQYTDLKWKYTGFKGYASDYRIVSNARNTVSRYAMTSAVRQEIQIASIPLFEFAVFYALDMEICPGSGNMAFNGRVHCNGTIYCQPAMRTVTFLDHVTAAQKILPTASPNDPLIRTPGTIVFQGEHDWNANSLNLPLGTNNSPSLLHALVEVPPGSESPSSLLGQQRYYNKADLIILVSNTTAVAKSGSYNNFAITIPWTNICDSNTVAVSKTKKRGRGAGGRPATTNSTDGVVGTNVTFFNKRENASVQTTEIDINQLLQKYSYLKSALGRDITMIYVGDFRTQPANTESGVRIVFGKALPPYGLTIATPNPLYIEGNYNVPDAYLGTTNTSASLPASVVADAITLLSDNWDDTNSASSLGSRAATSITVNSAVIAGIVPSGGGYYSGGVENFFRLLEDWSSQTLTFNGSIVVLFPSQIATAPWGLVPNNQVFGIPIRAYGFDVNFKDYTKLPPGTPESRTLIRSQWGITQANSTL